MRVLTRTFEFSAVVLLYAIAIVSCQRGHERNVIRLGAILPLTGDVASYGKKIQNGILLAQEHINRQGGVRGSKLEVQFEDDAGNPNAGVTAAQKLINIDRVPAIIGAVPSSVTLAIAPIAEQRHVVLLSPASSAPAISKAGDYIFRNYPSDDLEGSLIAAFAAQRGFKRCALLTIQNDYGLGLNRVFTTEYIRANRAIVANESYVEGTRDFRPILAKIASTKPDVIFIVGYAKDLGTIVRQSRELGVTAQFLSTVNFFDPESIASGGSAVDGVIFTSAVFDAESSQPEVSKFVSDYRARFGDAPDVWSAHGYDALLLLADAIRRNGASADDIKRGLYATSNFAGVAGATTFTKDGDVTKPARFMTVSDSRFAPLP